MQPVKTASRGMFAPLSVVFVAIATMLLSLVVPTPQDNDPLEFHFSLATNLGTFVLFVGASVLLLSSLKGFTPKLKRAYFLICGGMTLFAVSYLQVPFLVIFDLIDSFWLNSGLVVVPFIIGVVTLFAGTRMFARLIDIKHVALTFWFALVGSIVMALLIVVAPHPLFTTIGEDVFDAGQAILIVFAWLIALTAYHTLLIKQRAGLAYTNATAWLVLGLACMAVSGLAVVVLVQILPTDMQNVPTNVAYPISLLASILFLRSAYSFSRITAEANTTERWVARNFFGAALQPKDQGAISSLDIVVYAANLVSNPKAIDPILENVRFITSQIGQESEEKVLADKEQPLMSAYLNLEQYLTKQESVRIFTKQSLRQDIAQKLQLASGSATFWDKLPSAE